MNNKYRGGWGCEQVLEGGGRAGLCARPGERAVTPVRGGPCQPVLAKLHLVLLCLRLGPDPRVPLPSLPPVALHWGRAVTAAVPPGGIPQGLSLRQPLPVPAAPAGPGAVGDLPVLPTWSRAAAAPVAARERGLPRALCPQVPAAPCWLHPLPVDAVLSLSHCPGSVPSPRETRISAGGCVAGSR